MNRFIFQGQPNRVVFGHGTRREVRQELEGIGCHTPLILCTPGQLTMAREVASSFEGSARIFSQAQMHTPVTVTEQAMQLIEENKFDCLIAVVEAQPSDWPRQSPCAQICPNLRCLRPMPVQK